MDIYFNISTSLFLYSCNVWRCDDIFFMASFRNMLLNNEYSSEESTKDKGFVLRMLSFFSALNILNLVLGILMERQWYLLSMP